MNKKFKTSLIFTLLTFALYAQPRIDWQRNYGGSQFEQPFGGQGTLAGGIVIGGHSVSTDGIITSNQGDYDWWIIKLDSLGNIVWNKSFGGSLYDKSRYAIENPDGTVMAFGSVKSYDGDVVGNHNTDTINDYWLLKLDTVGNIIWKKCYGGSLEEAGRNVIRTSDGNYIMAGYARSTDGDLAGAGNHGTYDVSLIKVNDSDGSIIWAKYYGGSAHERVRGICELSNGDIVFSGNAECTDGDLTGTITHGDEDVWVAKVSSTGTLIWSKQYGTPGQDRASWNGLDLDGNILVAAKDSGNGGDVNDNHGMSDAWILKLDVSDGSIIWQKSFGGTGDDEAFRVFPQPDGGYVIGATCKSSDGDALANKGQSDYWIFKIDSNRNIVWQKNFGGPGWDHLDDMVKMRDGGYAGIGFSNSLPDTINPSNSDITFNYGNYDMWIVKISVCDSAPRIIASGPLDLITGQTVTLTTNYYESATYLWSNGATTSSITVGTAGLYFVTITNTSVGCVSYTDTAVVTVSVGIKEQNIGTISVYPNPANDKINITFSNKLTDATLSIKDISGKTLQSQKIKGKMDLISVDIDTGILKEGMYFIELSSDSGIWHSKFMKKSTAK